jgi:hypothetical protein
MSAHADEREVGRLPDEPSARSRANKIMIAGRDLLGAFARDADGNILEAVCHRKFRRFPAAGTLVTRGRR